MKLEIRIPSRCFIIAKKKPMVDFTSLKQRHIWVPQHNLVSSPHIAHIRDQTREHFFFLQTTETGCIFHKEEGNYKVEIVSHPPKRQSDELCTPGTAGWLDGQTVDIIPTT